MLNRLSLRSAFVVALCVATPANMVHAQISFAAEFESFRDEGRVSGPATSCGELRGQTGLDLSIDTATLITTRGGAGEVCLVRGQALPEVRFEVALPSRWNGRLFVFGNGGTAGDSFEELDRRERRDHALGHGFAVAQTNTGHDRLREPLFSFARDSQKLIDFAYRAVHVTALVAKTITRAYYRKTPDRSYFAGCSTGGRQGLMSAQRFPDDFDGILVGAPVLDIPAIEAQIIGARRALASSPLSAEKVEYLAAFVQHKCDAIDGVADGVVDDPRRCTVDFATEIPACGPGGDDSRCLSVAERHVLDVFARDVTSNGVPVYPAFPIGTGILAPDVSAPGGVIPYWLGQRDPPLQSGAERFVESYVQNVVPSAGRDWRTIDLDRDMHELQSVGALLNATDPDLRLFRARGGKLLMYHGWAEPQINPLLSVNYVAHVREAMGPTDDFLRLFMIPGMPHCRGGVGVNDVDFMTPLVDWVEHGVAPARIIATRRSGGNVVRSRPLCSYPRVARYGGTGSTDDAANFACLDP
jgi:feruloyl esterase